MTHRKTLLTLSALTLSLAFGLNPALADNGKAKGNNGARGNSAAVHGKAAESHTAKVVSKKTKSGKHGLASELKGLNAVKANPHAMEHASPNSQVGRIATYRDAALVTLEAQAALDTADAELALLPVPARDLETIDADIGALDPLAEGYAESLTALETERTGTQSFLDATAAVEAAALELDTAATTEEEALLAASKGRILSDEAIAYIRAVLNL